MDHICLTDHPNCLQQGQPQGGPFSMVKDTDGPTVRSNGPRNKYDHGLNLNSYCVIFLCAIIYYIFKESYSQLKFTALTIQYDKLGVSIILK